MKEKEEIYRIENLKNTSGAYYAVMIVVIVIYLLFFSSKWIFFNLSFREHSKIGQAITISSGVEAKVMAVSYSSNQHLIEAEIEVTNEDSSSKENNFDFYAIAKNRFGFKSYALSTKIILDTNNLRVVDIENVNDRFAQISLVVVPKGTDMAKITSAEAESFIFYIDHKNVAYKDEIKNIGYMGYMANRITRDINKKQKQIDKLIEKKEKKEKQNDILNQKNNELRTEKTLLTGNERDLLVTEENNNETQISSNISLIQSYSIRIKELNDEINVLKNNLKQLKKD